MEPLWNLVEGQPVWLPLTAAAAVVALTVWGVGRLRKSTWLSGIGPQAVVALGGVAVSVHGLWGFATTTAGLSPLLAIAFIAVFDAAEMTLLVMLYRSADPEVGWTRELRLMHRTAWMLVGFSGVMNAIHAPNWWARPILAAVPALAAWLIELQLRSKLHTRTDKDEDEEDGRPGPARLVLLIWQHAWAGLFALLGLDAKSSSSEIARAALAQKAAHHVYRLRLALEAGKPATSLTTRQAKRQTTRQHRRRRQAQKALDRADVATNPAQSLALARRLAALTRADDVAKLDYSDPTAVLTLVEDLSVTSGAERIAASNGAAEAEGARQRAEAARKEAESAQQRAEEAVTAAREELTRLEAERAAVLTEQESAASQSEGARERAAAARQEIESAQRRAEDILSTAQRNAEHVHTEGRMTLEKVQRDVAAQKVELETVAGQAQKEEDRRNLRADELAQLNAQVQEATLIRDRLRGDLAGLTPETSSTVPGSEDVAFRSDAKQAGWEHYLNTLQASGGQAEPTSGELAGQFDVNEGNARNWLRDFRAARAAQLAAHPPRAAAHPAVNGHAVAGL